MLKHGFKILTCSLLFLTHACALANAAHAESKYISQPVPPLFFKDLTPSPVSVKVMKVIDPLTFIGEDKNVYALSGIEVPNAMTGKSDLALEETKTLAQLIEGKDLKLYLTKNRDKGRINRMNQSLVQAELKQSSIWIEGELLASGLARVRTTPSNPEMIDSMLKVEAQARDAKTGLWADPNYQLLTPETAEGHDNAFQIVEGTPKAAAITHNMIFLNFGDDYKKDFTIGIPTSLRIAFARKNLDPLQLAHTKMRVRGWVQSYNGPFIEIDHPEQIELLGRPSPFADAASEPEGDGSPGAAGMRTISPPKPVAPKPPSVEVPKAEKPQPKQILRHAQPNP